MNRISNSSNRTINFCQPRLFATCITSSHQSSIIICLPTEMVPFLELIWASNSYAAGTQRFSRNNICSPAEPIQLFILQVCKTENDALLGVNMDINLLCWLLCIGTTVSAVTLNMYLKTAVSCYNIYAPRTLYLRVLVVLSLLYAKLMLCCSFPCTLWLLPIHVHTTHYYNFPKPKWSIPICIGRGGVRHSLVSTFSLQEASACFSATWQYYSSAKES